MKRYFFVVFFAAFFLLSCERNDLEDNSSSESMMSFFGIDSGPAAPADTQAPVITLFSTPINPTTDALINIDLTATDDVGITGWMINEIAAAPLPTDSGWLATQPATYTIISGFGTHELYVWARDAAGNVSALSADSHFTVDYSGPGDGEPPVVSYFSYMSPTTNPTVDPVISVDMTTSDNIGVTGWMITETATSPLPTDLGWQTAQPSAYTLTGGYGTYELYAWAMDAAGNVSAMMTPSHFQIVYNDMTAPVVASFTGPTATGTDGLSVSISASDDVGITGWMINETGVQPGAGDAGWLASEPTAYTLSGGCGAYEVYLWVKDAAGNVSAAATGTHFSVVYLDTVAPTVVSFSTSSVDPTTSQQIPVTMTVWDNTAVTGYMITESPTSPAAADPGWLAAAPATCLLKAIPGAHVLYLWLKDAAGNISVVSPASTLTINYQLPAYPVQVPRTGQTNCYDAAGAAVACSGTGQDGEYQYGATWPTTRFTDNFNGTITDNLTGLIWTTDAKLMNSPTYSYLDTDGTVDGRTDWQSALDFAAQLRAETYAGQTDWRIPNIIELKSLMNYGATSTAAWLTSNGFANVGTYYWSSTTYTAYDNASNHAQAWPVDFSSGEKYATPKSTIFNVWAVAGTTTILPKTGQATCYDTAGAVVACPGTGQDGEYQAGIARPDPRFTINGDGTTTDNLTGLMWTTDLNLMLTSYPTFDADQTAGNGGVYWENALAFVDQLNTDNYAGYNDWRLPNILELSSLQQYEKTFGQQFSTGFANYVTQCHWSSTTAMTSASRAYLMNVPYGTETGTWEKTGTTGSERYVWPVRGGN